MADCSFGDLACYGQSLASSAIGNAIDNMAKAVQEAFGKAVASLGTIWVNIGTPNLTGGDAPSIAAGTSAPNSEGITTVLGYVTWVSLAICGIAMIILGMIVASRLRSGQGIAAVGRAGIILGAVILISGASSLVSTILAAGPSGAGGAVAFLQAGLWWYMGALAVLSVIIGGARMAWEQRAEPGHEPEVQPPAAEGQQQAPQQRREDRGKAHDQHQQAEHASRVPMVELVADDGAKVRESLASRAETMRHRELAEIEGSAGEKSQSMLVAQLLLCAGFLVFLIFPAAMRVFQV